MRAAVLIASMALAVSAATAHPQSLWIPTSTPVNGNVTVQQAGALCGAKTQLNCCNKQSSAGDATNVASGLLDGLLSDTLGGLVIGGMFSECSPLNVTALVGVDSLLNSHCKHTAACCSRNDEIQGGLVNIGLPCLALGGLL